MTLTGEVIDVQVGGVRRGPKVRRDNLDLDHVWTLRQSLDDLPPIVVRAVDGHHHLVDGHHRTEAHRLEGRETIRAVVVDLDEDEAFEAAVTANTTHGMPLTRQDRRAAAAEMLRRRPDWSDRRIAEAVGLTGKVIASLRPDRPTAETPQLDGRRKGADGKARPATKAAAEAQREKLAEFYRANPDASLADGAVAAGGASKMTAAKAKAAAREDARPTGAPSLAPVPELDPEPEPREPRVGDFLTTWPAPGQWAKDDRFLDGTATHEVALFLDRRIWRDSDPKAADLVAAIPVAARSTVLAAAKHTAEEWQSLVDALSTPARPTAVEAR